MGRAPGSGNSCGASSLSDALILLRMSTNVYKYVRMILVNYGAMEVDVATLQEMRINLGLSQRQLAEKAGLSPGAVWRLEQRGSGRPDTLKKVADVLGVRPVDLLKKED